MPDRHVALRSCRWCGMSGPGAKLSCSCIQAPRRDESPGPARRTPATTGLENAGTGPGVKSKTDLQQDDEIQCKDYSKYKYRQKDVTHLIHYPPLRANIYTRNKPWL